MKIPRSSVLGRLLSALTASLTFGVAALEAGQGAAQPRPTIDAIRIPDGGVIRIDGTLDEEVWELANVVREFRQQEPFEGGSPSEPTEIRVLYDSRSLYIGGVFYDSEPGGILAHQLERDAGLGTDDRFMWILDTFQDGRTGYFFEINPAGLMGDGLIAGGGGGLNKRWDGIWQVRTRIHPHGWSAEIEIPFSTLNFNPDQQVWGINFQRTIRRFNEEILWSGWRRNESLFRPAHAGELRGLTSISQGVGIEVKPYLLTSADHAPAAGTPWDGSAASGVDITYSLTPSLRASLTVNTDFAEVEVDERRVNLTRFPLRFPEQRDFFLEGSGVFSWNWADPFFSRRIGLVEGQEVPIRYGARVGGQAGRYELGFYQIRTGRTALSDREESWPEEHFTVGRVKRSLFEQSHVGVIYTGRRSGFMQGQQAVPDRHTVGADFDLYTSRAFGRYNAQVEGFLLFHTDGIDGGDLFAPQRRSRGVRINFPNDLIRFHTSHREFGVEWDPAVGFTERRGFRRHQPTFTVAPRPQWRAVRQTEHSIALEYLTDVDGRLLTRNLDFTLLQMNFDSGDRLSVGAGRGFERLDAPFTIRGGDDEAIEIQPGDYDTSRWSVGAQTAGRRMLSGSANVERTDFWDGTRTQIEVSVTVRPRRGVALSTTYARNEVRLPGGDFSTNLARLEWSWNLNPLTSFTGNVQYDDVSSIVGLFARGRWIVRPGSEIFLVWSHNWRYESDLENRVAGQRLTTLSQGVALKANYSYRF